MKRMILTWLLLAALLTGCGIPQEDAPDTTAEELRPVQTEPAPGWYEPGSSLEQQTNGALRLYLLDLDYCAAAEVMGEGILLFSEQEETTRLILLTGDNLVVTEELTVDFILSAQLPSTQVTGEGLSYFDPNRRETVVLDETLREITRIQAPEDLTGAPLLSANRETLYYCTAEGIRAMELETGISRLLRQDAGKLVLEGLLQEDSLLHCTTANGGETVHSFYSAQTGQLVERREDILSLTTEENGYVGTVEQDGMPVTVFGTGSAIPQTLDVQEDCQLLADSFVAVGTTYDNGTTAKCYDLSTGTLRSAFTVTEFMRPVVTDGGDGILWLLAWSWERESWILCRWDTNACLSGDPAVYTHTYYSRSNPDLAGIAGCQALAQEIGQKYGVQILVWEDALEMAPWDYRMTEEYHVPLLNEQLRLLDQRLSHFPEGFLTQLAEAGSGLTICLVRKIQGVEGVALDTASGIQYWLEGRPCIALTTSATEGSLYHELCHVMDTRVFAHSNAYDQWEELNPSGFKYDYDYAANATRNAGEYLRDAERCFIDTYSMSFPKEDRARVLEYAMTEGNEHYFQSKVMQAKLKQICLGLREAFGLKKSPETFLWEQYLAESLAYDK